MSHTADDLHRNVVVVNVCKEEAALVVFVEIAVVQMISDTIWDREFHSPVTDIGPFLKGLNAVDRLAHRL